MFRTSAAHLARAPLGTRFLLTPRLAQLNRLPAVTHQLSSPRNFSSLLKPSYEKAATRALLKLIQKPRPIAAAEINVAIDVELEAARSRRSSAIADGIFRLSLIVMGGCAVWAGYDLGIRRPAEEEKARIIRAYEEEKARLIVNHEFEKDRLVRNSKNQV